MVNMKRKFNIMPTVKASRRRILFSMIQLATIIIIDKPKPPIETSKAWIAGRPAMMRKYIVCLFCPNLFHEIG
jgi:hypothetical protein